MKKPIANILITASGLTVIDQITKTLALKYFQTPITIIENFFLFTYSENEGIAFGISFPKILLIIFIIILLVLVYYLGKKELNLNKTLSQISISLIIAGGFSNLIDRLVHGFVIDFISIWIWPTFNIADIYITVGVLLILVFYGKIKRA